MADFQGYPGTLAVIREIEAERRRQISAEGWTAEHDDAHENGVLAFAGASYAASGAADNRGDWLLQRTKTFIREVWPFNMSWWKPSTPRRDLIKAAALIVAEIERIDRQTKAASHERDEVGHAQALLARAEKVERERAALNERDALLARAEAAERRVAELVNANDNMNIAIAALDDRLRQILGAALGCAGDHSAESLAATAARRTRERERLAAHIRDTAGEEALAELLEGT